MDDIFKILGVKTPDDVLREFSRLDQKLMTNGEWNYENEDLVINKTKDILEKLDLSTLSKEELQTRKYILWLWNHHAISSAIGKKNKEKAQEFASKAMEYKSDENPNQITKLLALLVNDKLPEAEEHSKNITKDYEQKTAQDLIQAYKEGKFF